MTDKSDHIGVFGLGAIGSAIGEELLQSHSMNTIHFYSRTPKNFIKLKKENSTHELPIMLESLPYKKGQVAWLIVCIKEHQISEAIHALSGLIHSKTKVAVIRNGLRLKEPYLDFMDESQVLECSIDCPTQPVENGFYKVYKNPIITVQACTLANEFSLLFKDSQLTVNQVSDYHTENWKKVCESSASGAILCLTGETCWIFENEKLRTLYSDILKEAVTVALADGAKLENDFRDKMLTKLLSYPKSKGSSMLTDRLNGNPIELGAKNKIICQIGKLRNVETPLNDLVVTLLQCVNKNS